MRDRSIFRLNFQNERVKNMQVLKDELRHRILLESEHLIFAARL